MPVASFEFATVATITYHRLQNGWLCSIRQPAVICCLANLMCTGWSWRPFCILWVHNVLGSKRPTLCRGGGGERAPHERRAQRVSSGRRERAPQERRDPKQQQEIKPQIWNREVGCVGENKVRAQRALRSLQLSLCRRSNGYKASARAPRRTLWVGCGGRHRRAKQTTRSRAAVACFSRPSCGQVWLDTSPRIRGMAARA